MVEIKGQLDKIKYYLKNEFYDTAVKETGAIFEQVLKKIYASALSDFTFEQRNELMEMEKQIGINQGYADFGFGKLVGLFNRSKLLDKMSKMRGENLSILRSISLDPFVDLRNILTHPDPKKALNVKVDEHTARLFYECLMNWLAFVGYAELPLNAENMMKPVGSTNPKEESTINNHLNDKIKSTYNPNTSAERKRLIVQARLCEEIDKQSFEFALKKIGKHEEHNELIGLDVGAATGFVTESRFKREYGFTKVIGVDKEASILQPDHDYFIYRQLNVEDDEFEEKIEELMTQLEVTSFDIVYLSFALHHLTNPIKFLRRIRKVMSANGVIILKGVDDGAQLAFSDNGLVQEITNEFLELEGISDRLHARKFYYQLRSAGFENVEMRYQVTNTVGLSPDEKEAIFNYYFGFRKFYSKRLMDKYPDDLEQKKRHEKFVEKIEKLEECFLKPDLYYHVLLVTAIGVK